MKTSFGLIAAVFLTATTFTTAAQAYCVERNWYGECIRQSRGASTGVRGKVPAVKKPVAKPMAPDKDKTSGK
jgi:hypothetical protein